MIQHAEELLEIFDWTGLDVEFYAIPLGPFKGLLEEARRAPKAKYSSQ